MRIVLQRVFKASVEVEKSVVGSIDRGFLILLGITHADTEKEVDWLVEKISKLRLFGDDGSNSFMDKNIQDISGAILVVSQFTLFGDCRKGTKPSFTDAARPEQAEKLYNYFVEKIRQINIPVQTGRFGAHMAVALVNDGPVTLVLDTKQ